MNDVSRPQDAEHLQDTACPQDAIPLKDAAFLQAVAHLQEAACPQEGDDQQAPAEVKTALWPTDKLQRMEDKEDHGKVLKVDCISRSFSIL